MADLKYNNKVLDPACGTGRFLIHAMNDMFNSVEKQEITNSEKKEKIEHISKYQLYGSDIDQRIAKIAKMNMWIHGDGKSNIFGGREYNGLTLNKHISTLPNGDSFDKNFDIVLTNPPLGDLNYQTLDFGKHTIKHDVGSDEYKKAYRELTLNRLPFLPIKNETEAKIKEISERIQSYTNDLNKFLDEQLNLELDSNVKKYLAETNIKEKKKLEENEEIKKYNSFLNKINKKRTTIDKNNEILEELKVKIKTNQSDISITGNNLKGGAQFLGVIWHYLKDKTSYSDLIEWKGGKTLIVLDEGVLNTDEYSKTREFIKNYFYIKAVVSLTRDTFIPVSNTNVKTSILYLIKKTDVHAVQKEPIFFAHVNKVGMNTKGKVIKNDLPDILNQYRRFKKNVEESYINSFFNESLFKQKQA